MKLMRERIINKLFAEISSEAHPKVQIASEQAFQEIRVIYFSVGLNVRIRIYLQVQNQIFNTLSSPTKV